MKQQLQLSIDKLVDFVLEHEGKDFYEYPSRGHVYYHALVVSEGIDKANAELIDALVKKQKENDHA